MKDETVMKLCRVAQCLVIVAMAVVFIWCIVQIEGGAL